MAEKKRITHLELRKLGREDGEVLAKVFEKFMEPYGVEIPNNIVDLFLEWQRVQVNECIDRFRNAGLNAREIDVWHRAMRAVVKKQADALLRTMARKH